MQVYSVSYAPKEDISIDEAKAYSMSHPINLKKISILCLKGSKPPVTSSSLDVAAIDFFLCIWWPDSDLID